jgi:hypothetical protein
MELFRKVLLEVGIEFPPAFLALPRGGRKLYH